MNKPSEATTLSAQVTPQTPVERFRKWGIIAWSIIGVLILAGVVLWALMRVEEIFPPLVLALVTIYILNPVVTRLEHLGVRRLFGSCMTYLLMLAIVAIILALLIPALIDQGQALARDLPHTIDRISQFATSVTRGIEDRFGARVNVGEWLGGRSDLIERAVGGAGGFLQGAVQTMTLVVIGLVVGFYLLIDLPRLRAALLRLFPPDRRDEARTVASSVGTAMGGFFRGQLLVALIVGVLSSVGLRLIGLPYWLVVGFIAGFFNLIPLIGPFVGAIPAIVIAAALRPPITILWVVIVMTVVQQIDNHFISPNVMRLTVRLHPVTIMISLIAGATLAGFWGMLVAVPFVASAKVVAAHFWRTRVPWGEEAFQEGEKMEALADEQIAPPAAELEKTTASEPDVDAADPGREPSGDQDQPTRVDLEREAT